MVIRPSPALVILALGLALVSAFHSDLGLAQRRQLAIPDNAKGVIILGQTSHLDWDWLNFFGTNVNNTPPDEVFYFSPDPTESPQPTDTIFSLATKLLSAAPGKYGYSIAEMGFLRRFAENKPSLWAQMKRFNPQTFSIVGGGITSPDDLLPHGEAFLRNFLSGQLWLRAQNVSWTGTVWLPDDFGHDSQLPVMLEAMGVKSLSFSRIPGGCQNGFNPIPEGAISAHRMLLDPITGGLNFYWQANDGSTTFSYYMPNSYCDGEIIDSPGKTCVANRPSDLFDCGCSINVFTPLQRIRAWYNVRANISNTPYTFVPIGCDFATPFQNMTNVIADWNKKIFPSTGIYAASSQFDKYAQLTLDWMANNGSEAAQPRTRNFHGSSTWTMFRPTPYWMGFYTSRPFLKQSHFEVAKALLASETFLVLAKALEVNSVGTQKEVDALWDELAPSTHHDFITGTSTDYVYQGEQIPLMTALLQKSILYREGIISKIISALNLSNGYFQPHSPDLLASGASGVIVFNQNGFPVHDQLVKFDIPTPHLEEELSYYGNSVQHVESHVEGMSSLVTLLDAPSLGYKVYPATSIISQHKHRLSKLGKANSGVRVHNAVDNDVVTLENSELKAVISKANNWAITSLIDKNAPGGPKSFLKMGNALQWRNDGGNIYRFGYEEGCGFDRFDAKVIASDPVMVESGPIRTLVRVTLTMVASYPDYYPISNFTIEYSLIQNENFLRINVTGAAAERSAVVTGFQFNSLITNYTHGTPYHWDWKQPYPFGLQSDFKVTMEATHDFIGVMDSKGSYLGAVYHVASPTWGVINDTLYGVILRNSPGGTENCHNYGADGSDSDSHSILFAIRVPSSFSHLSAHKEARAYNTPLISRPIGQYPLSSIEPLGPLVQDEYSLASIKGPSNAFITALKGGSFNPSGTVLRIYNPSNAPAQLQVSTGTNFIPKGYSYKFVTAMEVPIERRRNTHSFEAVSSDGPILYVNTTRALHTLALTKKGF